MEDTSHNINKDEGDNNEKGGIESEREDNQSEESFDEDTPGAIPSINQENAGEILGEIVTGEHEDVRVVYPQIYNLRKHQASLGWNNSNLTPVQRGIEPLERCHHITMIQTAKERPKSYRVRICRRCTGQDHVLDLGTYIGHESAILVHDGHEICSGRFEKLLALIPQDSSFLHLLVAHACARRKQAAVQRIPDVVEWRIRRNAQSSQANAALADKKSSVNKRMRQSLMSNSIPIQPTASSLTTFVTEKISPLLIPMSEISASSYNSTYTEWFQEGFQYVLGKALSNPIPPPTTAGSPEKVLAAKSILLLGSFLSHRSPEMTHLINRLSSQCMGGEKSMVFSRILVGLSAVQKDQSHIPQVLKLTSEYISDVESNFWTLLHQDKFPRENEARHLQDILEQTEQFMHQAHRNVQLSSRIQELILSLGSYITELHPEASRWRRVLFELRMFNSTQSDHLSHCCIRLADFKKSLEYLEICSVMASPSYDFIPHLPPMHKFLGCYTRLEVEELRMRLYNEHGVRTTPPAKCTTLLTNLMTAATSLGCLVINDVSSSTPSTSSTAPPKINDPCTLLQLRILTCVALLSYSSMHGFNTTLPHNMQINEIFYQLHEAISSLEPMLQRIEEKSLIFSCQFRALFRIVSLCREAVKFTHTDLFACADMSRMSFVLLQRGSQRFDVADCYIFWTSQFVSEINGLEQDAKSGKSANLGRNIGSSSSTPFSLSSHVLQLHSDTMLGYNSEYMNNSRSGGLLATPPRCLEYASVPISAVPANTTTSNLPLTGPPLPPPNIASNNYIMSNSTSNHNIHIMTAPYGQHHSTAPITATATSYHHHHHHPAVNNSYSVYARNATPYNSISSSSSSNNNSIKLDDYTFAPQLFASVPASDDNNNSSYYIHEENRRLETSTTSTLPPLPPPTTTTSSTVSEGQQLQQQQLQHQDSDDEIAHHNKRSKADNNTNDTPISSPPVHLDRGTTTTLMDNMELTKNDCHNYKNDHNDINNERILQPLENSLSQNPTTTTTTINYRGGNEEEEVMNESKDIISSFNSPLPHSVVMNISEM